jgi:sulfide:quinone oxidoreductase
MSCSVGAGSLRFDGAATCYVETGTSVARIDVNFLSYDTPVAKFTAPTTKLVAEKREFGTSRLSRWFGYDDPEDWGQR